MKKLTVWLSTLIVAIIGVCCLVACGGDPVGTYKFDSMSGKMEGLEINVKVGDKLMGIVELTEDYMVLEIKEDNTFMMTAMGEKGESGTWKQDGGKVVLTIDGEDMTVDLSGNSITFEQEGMKIVLKK